MEKLAEERYTNQRLYFGRYICREWNARHAGAEQLTTFEITYMWQPTLPNHPPSAPEKVVLWEHSCF